MSPISNKKLQEPAKGKVSQASQINKNTLSEDDEVIKEEHGTSVFLKSIYRADEEDGTV